MDFLKKGQEMTSGNNNQQQGNTNTNTQQNTGAGNAGQEDYGDKGSSFSFSSPHSPLPPPILTFDQIQNRVLIMYDPGLDFIEKKTGHTMSRDTNEKITDGARGLYEKATGFAFPTPSILPPLSMQIVIWVNLFYLC